MTRPALWMARSLSLGHFAWGLALLLIAAWLMASAILILPRMSTPITWIEVLLILLYTGIYAMPLGSLGVWLLVLARRLWSGRHPVRAALLVTHGILLLPGVLAIVVGVLTLLAAEASAAKGGGLLGVFGVIPLGSGACVVALALPSILFAKFALPQAPAR